MKKRKKQLIFYICCIPILVLFLILLGYILTPQPVNAMMVGLSSMTEYENHIYMEQSIPEETQEEIMNDYGKSKDKILDYFDEITAKPTIIFVQSQETTKRYAQNRTGQTYYMYWGNYIVIGPNGFNEDVIAHELMHSELRERVDKKDSIPVWFDEGLAMLVDDRFSINHSDKVDFEELERLATRSVFYDPLSSSENYLTSKSEVSRWYSISGKQGLINLINGLNDGTPFYKLYNESEN